MQEHTKTKLNDLLEKATVHKHLVSLQNTSFLPALNVGTRNR